MRYRGALSGVPNLDRTVETHSQSLRTVEKWAQDVLKQYPVAQYPGAEVQIFETKEIYQWSRRHPPQPELSEPVPACSYNHDSLMDSHSSPNCPGCGKFLKKSPEEEKQ